MLQQGSATSSPGHYRGLHKGSVLCLQKRIKEFYILHFDNSKDINLGAPSLTKPEHFHQEENAILKN